MLQQARQLQSCYIGPEISPEQFVSEHFFLYIEKGLIHGYDGHRHQTLHAGEAALVRRNRLARYNKELVEGAFVKVVVVLDRAFLEKFRERHEIVLQSFHSDEAFHRIHPDPLIGPYIQSLAAYYEGAGKINPAFADVKREELLLILLKANPELGAILYEQGQPEKIDLEDFMNRNFRFNVPLQRFAYMTGRSLTSFKRDFEAIFHESPSKWLMRKRLNEARFLLEKKGRKASDIYLELGFEDLSHFSFAFKKQFGLAPTHMQKEG